MIVHLRGIFPHKQALRTRYKLPTPQKKCFNQLVKVGNWTNDNMSCIQITLKKNKSWVSFCRREYEIWIWKKYEIALKQALMLPKLLWLYLMHGWPLLTSPLCSGPAVFVSPSPSYLLKPPIIRKGSGIWVPMYFQTAIQRLKPEGNKFVLILKSLLYSYLYICASWNGSLTSYIVLINLKSKD